MRAFSPIVLALLLAVQPARNQRRRTPPKSFLLSALSLRHHPPTKNSHCDADIPILKDPSYPVHKRRVDVGHRQRYHYGRVWNFRNREANPE